MALTNLSQITTSGIATLTDINLNNITGVAATFTGNVTVGGTLTYDDVTNIDSVGLITARSGVRVQTGTATTALVVEGDARVTGILTVGSSSLTLDGTNNVVNVGTALTLGHTQGLQFHTQNLHSQGFDVNNVNATGIVTATTFIGNLTGTASNASGATGDFSIADKIVHTGDTNTAIRFPAVDTVTVETAGSERLRIFSGGQVAIATATNYAHANADDLIIGDTGSDETGITIGSVNQGQIAFADSGDNRAGLIHYQHTDNSMRFMTAGAGNERLRITSAGNIGIGLTNPGALLHLESTAENAARLRIGFDSPRYYDIFRGSTTNSGYLNFYGSQSSFTGYIFDGVDGERLRIDSSGRLLKSGQASLTSTTLSYPIQVAAASDANAIAIFGRAADDIGELAFYEADKTTKLGELQYRQDHLNLRCRVGDIRFASGGTSETLRIDGSGRIAQGGKTPTNHGSPNLLIWGSDPTVHLTSTGSTANTSYTGIKFAVAGGSTGDYSKAGIFVQRQSSYNDLDMIFAFRSTNDAAGVAISDEKIRITSSGDLGLGVSANTNQAGTLYIVGGQGVRWSHPTDGTLYGDHYVSSGGNHVFRNGASLTERLRINSDGKVSIGAGLPASGAGTFNVKPASSTDSYFKLRPASEFDGAITGAAIDIRNSSNGASQHLVLRAQEFRFWCDGTDRIRMTSTGLVGINAVPGDYTQALILQSNSAATTPSHLKIRGGATGYSHSYISLNATSSGNSAGNTRGLGTYLYDEVSDVEWFVGRPYSQSDYYVIARDPAAAPASATAQHSKALVVVDNVGRLTTKGEQRLQYSYSGALTTKVTTARGRSGTFSTCTVTIESHAYGSMAYDILLGGYSNAHAHRVGTYYINGQIYGSYTSVSNVGGSVSASGPNYVATQKSQWTFSKTNGFVHPICSVTAAFGGSGYLDHGDISIVWS